MVVDTRSPVFWRNPRAAGAMTVVMGLAVFLNFTHLGARSLDGDEAIYATAAWQAAGHGHWYPPIVRREVYGNKPPLVVWLPGVSFRFFGVDELADRLPAAAAGVGVAVLLGLFTAWLLGSTTGALAACLFVTSRPWLLEHGAREGVGDAPLTLFTMAALLLYLRHRSTGRWSWLVLASLAVALGALLKGPVGPLFFLGTTLAWEALLPTLPGARSAGTPALRRRLLLPLVGVSLGLCVYGAWIADTFRRVPDFGPMLFDQTVRRVVLGIAAAHVHGPAFYFGVLWRAFGAWWLALPFALAALWRLGRQGDPRSRGALLVGLWALVPFVLVTLSASKLPWYLDPALPAYAVVLAAGCAEVGRQVEQRRWLWVTGLVVLSGFLTVRGVRVWQALPGSPERSPMHRLALAAHWPGVRVLSDGVRPDTAGLREWNYFYLYWMEDVLRPLPQAFRPGTCDFVLSLHPDRLRQQSSFAAAQWLATKRRSVDEPLLMVADLCPGSLAR